MDIVVRGRGTEVPERFRRHVTEKVARLERFDDRIIMIDVEVNHESNPRRAEESERIEVTVRSRGPVIRAEAAASDVYGALDLALGKLEARMRRAMERRRDRRRGNGASPRTSQVPVEVPLPSRGLGNLGAAEVAEEVAEEHEPGFADVGELIVREKVHEAIPMSLDQALYEMELVGHDFFLFVDEASSRPSVVYRRRGYDYGVIRLGA